MARLWFNVDIKGQFSLSWPAFVLRLLPAGKAERAPYSSFATQVTQSVRGFFFYVFCLISLSEYPFWLCSNACPFIPCVPVLSLYCPQQGFLPSEIPMPSPNAISPSGLKSSSQFYSYDGSNPRRRSSQEPIGREKIYIFFLHPHKLIQICVCHHFSCFVLSKVISLPHTLEHGSKITQSSAWGKSPHSINNSNTFWLDINE